MQSAVENGAVGVGKQSSCAAQPPPTVAPPHPIPAVAHTGSESVGEPGAIGVHAPPIAYSVSPLALTLLKAK